MNKVVLLALLAGTVVICLCGQFLQAAVERIQVPIADSPQIGPENAPVTVVEFLDYT